MEIIPGIGLGETDGTLIQKIALVRPYVSWVQLDIVDNTLITGTSLTDPVVLGKILEKYKTGPSFEAHLMVRHPERMVKGLVEAGFARLIAHVEADEPREFLAEARAYHCEVGLALDTETPIDVIEPFLEEIDCVLVMTADAGASGQAFQPDMAEKIRLIHHHYPDLPIEVDCGMNPETAKIVVDAGATRIVTTSYIFKDPIKTGEAIGVLAAIG